MKLSKYCRGCKCSTCRWVPVSERLPEKDGKYLVVVAGDKIEEPYVLTWYFFDGHFEAFVYFPTRYITHWMPLPEPPKEEQT